MSPRPILKSMPGIETITSSSPLPFASCPQVLHSPHVHFPPTPTLTTTDITHSPFAYDRAPIVVSPNACALPERGGRVYFDATYVSEQDSVKELKGSYFHPRAFEVCEYEPVNGNPSRKFCDASYHTPPSLTPDVSSESEESDNYVSPPLSSPIPRISSKCSRNTSYSQHHQVIDTDHREEVGHTTTFQSYPPSLVKDKKKDGRRERSDGKKSRSGLKREVLRRSMLSSSFNDESPLDGCLSGF